MFLKLPFAVSFSVLFITIPCAVFRKSFNTFYVSLLYIYICVTYLRPLEPSNIVDGSQ